MTTEVCTLGGGCFWCLDGAFRRVKGIQSVSCGYSGGEAENPTYEQVCSGETGHAEVVQLSFDNSKISYSTILELFFDLHDPTTLNRQGADVGTQYRSAIYYHDENQKQIAKEMMGNLEAKKVYADKIVTQLEPFDVLYEAEKYHQDYANHNPENRYCQMVVNPKLTKFLKSIQRWWSNIAKEEISYDRPLPIVWILKHQMQRSHVSCFAPTILIFDGRAFQFLKRPQKSSWQAYKPVW